MTSAIRKIDDTLRALDQAHQKLEYHINNSPLAVVEWDSQRGVTQWSKRAEELFGWTAEEVLSTRWEDLSLCHEDDKEYVDTLTKEAYRNKKLTFICKNRNYTKSGSIIETEWYNSLLPNKDGTVGSVLSLVLDVTERNRTSRALLEAQENLRHSQKMEALGTLAGGVAHDFNNILGGIIGYLELSLLTPDLPVQLRHDIKQALSGSLRARDLAGRILTFGRRNTYTFRFINLSTVMEECIEFIRGALPSNLSLVFDNQSQDTTIFADSTAIQQVIYNLTTNASHAMNGKKGLIIVSLSNYKQDPTNNCAISGIAPGNYIKISVKDTGHGIPHEIQKRIFEPYFTTKEIGQGSGLGLSVVHGIISSHHGQIFVKSDVGVGTLFEIFLPLVDNKLFNDTGSELNEVLRRTDSFR